MKKRQLLVIGGGLLTAAVIFAQTLPSTVPLATREHQSRGPSIGTQGFSWVFTLNGKKYQSTLDREQIASSTDWTLTSALPLPLAKAEELARGVLRKYISDDSTWEVTEINLRRLNEETGAKWYYVVRLMPKVRDLNVLSDTFYVPISFSGEVGWIHAYGK